ncbi:MAG: tRNA (cytidine(34)-2'-O)-methyltransferase, partial [Gammaproteobacteria bacterium]|nr:tRNA (cytidine(34)-2'-O)-methyltransferase [Gammaproteobacteria bacterium]
NLILFHPEIPPNTGNIIRLCANTGTLLHLVKPLGFRLEDAQLRRAGLDYHEWATVRQHDSLPDCLASLGTSRTFAMSTRGTRQYSDPAFAPGDAFLLGPESSGLPVAVLATLPAEQVLRIPMRTKARSLNLSNAASVVIYEAWRQQGFA